MWKILPSSKNMEHENLWWGDQELQQTKHFCSEISQDEVYFDSKKDEVFNRPILALQASNTQNFHNSNGFIQLLCIIFRQKDPICRVKTSIPCRGRCTLETPSKRNNLHTIKCAMLTMVLLKGSTQLSSFASAEIAIRARLLFSFIRRPMRISSLLTKSWRPKVLFYFFSSSSTSSSVT